MTGERAGHDRHASHSDAMLRDRFWWILAFTIPVVIWSGDIQHWLGYTTPSFPGSKWIPPVFGTMIFFYGGLVFLRGALGELADRKPGMMLLGEPNLQSRPSRNACETHDWTRILEGCD
jgi:P-type Cu2+ transporter